MEVLYEVYMYMEQVEILNFDELGAKQIYHSPDIRYVHFNRVGEQIRRAKLCINFFETTFGVCSQTIWTLVILFWTKILIRNSKYLNSRNTCDIIKYLVNCVNTIL